MGHTLQISHVYRQLRKTEYLSAAQPSPPDDRASPDTTAASMVGEAASCAMPGAGNAAAGGDESSESLDIIG